MMSKLFSVGTDDILLEAEEIKNLRPQEIHLGSVYLIVRDFEKSISFYEQLLSMPVSTRNCGNKFAGTPLCGWGLQICFELLGRRSEKRI